MGSPVTLSGFNKIDFGAILDSVMIQERQPIARIETQKETLEAQDTAFGTLAGKLSTLQSALETLKETDSMAVVEATSTDDGVSVSTTGGTIEGSYAVVVSELAQAQSLASSSTYAALTDEIATGGTLTITPATGSPLVITLTGSTTLEGLVDTINAETDATVFATSVQSSPGSYQLVLTSKDTGLDNAFTVTDALTGGAGVTFTDTDTDGISGDSAADNSQNALDASLTVNGLQITSASNAVTGVVPGVTLTLNTKDPAKTVTVGVTRDLTEARARVETFITAYNDVVTFAKDQTSLAYAGKASIGRDPLLRSFRSLISSAIRDDYAGGTYTRLGEVGVGFDITGQMTLDEEAFDAAMTASPTAVQTLFSTAGVSGTGAFGALDGFVENYTQTGGLVASVRQQITDQVSALSQRLDTLETRLFARRQTLQQQYTAADLAMSRLNSQSASLSALGGQYRLF